MAAQFPVDIPTFTDPNPSTTLAVNMHTARHIKIQQEIAALATRVGITGSVDTSTHEKKIFDLQTDVAALEAGSTNSVYENEVPGGSVNGSNTAFTTLNPFIATSLKVYKNGIRLKGTGEDYTEGSGAFTMVVAPASGTRILVDYMTSAGISNNADTVDGYHAAGLISAALAAVYPIGSVYTNAGVSTNPATLLGFGTWVAFATGQVLVGVDTGQTEFNTLGEVGGEKTHVLTTPEMPTHTHGTPTTRGGINWTGGSSVGQDSSLGNAAISTSTGGGGAHNNLQPYITVYMWKRTA